MIALGIALDFLLVTAWGDARGHCRLGIVTHDGMRLWVNQLDPPLLDALLTALKARLDQPLAADSQGDPAQASGAT